MASKCGSLLGPPPPGSRLPFPHDYSAANVAAGIGQSLRRLRTDRLGLVQVHISLSVAQMQADRTIERLVSAHEQGRVRFLGMSGILPNLPDHMAMGVFDVFQIPYSAVQREHEDLITAAASAGTLIRGGAARGGLAEEQNWCRGPLGLAVVEGQRRWAASGVEDLLGDTTRLELVLQPRTRTRAWLRGECGSRHTGGSPRRWVGRQAASTVVGVPAVAASGSGAARPY